jgi:hypothetical protein
VSQLPEPFTTFLGSLRQLTSPSSPPSTAARKPFQDAASVLRELATVDRASLSELVSRHPDWVPIIASVVGLSHEQLKNVMKLRLGTSGWIKLGRRNPSEIVDLLDREYGLVARVNEERHRQWSYGDILFERAASRGSASRAIGRGRSLEDEVEAVVASLGLSYKVRTNFNGRGGRRGSCDVAIPDSDDKAKIVCAVKGFDSTGSKLTDAVREIETMADIRDATQFVFAVVDGIGWLNRQSDLRRIYDLWVKRSINGLFSSAGLGNLRDDLFRAATIHGLL